MKQIECPTCGRHITLIKDVNYSVNNIHTEAGSMIDFNKLTVILSVFCPECRRIEQFTMAYYFDNTRYKYLTSDELLSIVMK